MSAKKILIIITIIAMILAFIWAFFSSNNNSSIEELTQELKQEEKRPDLLLSEATIAEIIDGIKYWEIHTLSSKFNKENGITNLDKLEGIFLKKNTPVLGIVAPKAHWKMEENKIFINDPICYSIGEKRGEERTTGITTLKKSIAKIIPTKRHYPSPNKTSYWFTAQRMEWSLDNKKVIGKENIKLMKGNIKLSAQKLIADVALDKITLLGRPQIVIN